MKRWRGVVGQLAVLATVSAWCGFVGPSVARADSYSASYGQVQAQLTDQTRSGVGLRLQITRAGQPFVFTKFAAACRGFSSCQPAPDTYGAPVLVVRPSGGVTEPDVFVHLTNGGNICCRSTFIYHYDAAAFDYIVSVHVWGDAADSGPPKTLGHPGNVYFVSDDGRFRYRFGCGACTPGPIQIWRDNSGVLVNVTRSFPALIANDARKWLHLYYQQFAAPYGADGLMAAYVADEYLLGKARTAWRLVHREGSAGHLTDPGSGFTSASMFYKQVRRFLHRLGYG